MNDPVEVAIIGAGPYGLSLAAHLRAAGVRYRQFGLPMNLWRTAMPRGMYLKSQGFASNLSDPGGQHTLRNYCRDAGLAYADYGVPVSLDTFIDYGEWFRAHHAPDVEQVHVTQVSSGDRYFLLTLTSADQVRARNVVVAAGVEHFAQLPRTLSELPAQLCTHSCDHSDLSVFAGKEVVVVGAGQSALESAALLHENGAEVHLVVRRSRVTWNGYPLSPQRPLYRRVREPEAGLGSGLSTWFYSEHPRAFRRLPRTSRITRARHALGPAGAWWLRDRVDGRIPVHTEHRLVRARSERDRVRLGLRVPCGTLREFGADHVIGATGYPPDLGQMRFLDDRLRARLDTIDRAPRVDGDFEASVPGLFFVGAAVAATFGPVMRFVYGADFAVRRLTNRLVSSSARSSVVVGEPSR